MMIKRTTINAYQVGLVFEKGKLTNVLEAGSYWIFGNKEVKIYEMKQSFVAPIEINILLQNQKQKLCTIKRANGSMLT